jgi:hypothetical protein
MQILLTVAVILIALAIIVQAGVLVSMYLMSRKLANKADVLMTAGQRLMPPLETITNNLKTTSDHLADSGKIAREQVMNVQQFVTESQHNIQQQIREVRGMVLDTVDEARKVVMRPVRQYAAIATAIAEGVRTFFSGRKQPEAITEETVIITNKQRPAA